MPNVKKNDLEASFQTAGCPKSVLKRLILGSLACIITQRGVENRYNPSPHGDMNLQYWCRFLLSLPSREMLSRLSSTRSNGFTCSKSLTFSSYLCLFPCSGIPYLNQDEESQLREQTEERRNQHANGIGTPSFISPSSSKGPTHVPEEHKEFINTVV